MEAWNINIRFYSETHEVLLHPYYYNILINKCTTARENISKEHLIEKAYNAIHPISKIPGVGVGFTKRASELLIDSAVKFGFLHDRFHWDDKGYVINVLSPNDYPLDEYGKMLFFKYYMESDGGALIHIINKMREYGEEVERSIFMNENKVELSLLSMIDDYLLYVYDPIDRSYLRRFITRLNKGYTKHTREHRFNPRAEVMVDFGVLNKTRVNREINYGINDITDRFAKLFPDVHMLDESLLKEGDFHQRVSDLYNKESQKIDINKDYELVVNYIVMYYDRIKDDFYRLAHIKSLSDIIWIKLLLDDNIVCEEYQFKHVLEQFRQQNDNAVKYHVDDWGRNKFLTISDRYVDEKIE
jgi:hypothetical protein